MTTILTANAAVVAALMLAFWLASVVLKNVGVVDIAWGLGFALIAWTTFALRRAAVDAPADAAVSVWLMPVLVTIWAARLSVYVGWRNHGRPEDKRYAAMRRAREPGFWWKSLGIVFGLQAVVMGIVALPLLFAAGQVVSRPAVAAIGAALWLVGMIFEAGGDWQLARFKSDPANTGRVMDRGLWRYTRHPNYFGDFCVWWGLFAIACSAGAPWWTAAGPAVLTFFLLKVSGVTLLESTLVVEKPEYADYVRRTSPFFPRRPRRADRSQSSLTSPNDSP